MATRQEASIDQIRGARNGIADGFDEFVTPVSLVLGKNVVRRLGLHPGTRLLDVAVSVHGVSLFPDMARGLAELVRVTRPGGRVVVVAPGPVETVEFIVFVISALLVAVPGATSTDPSSLPFPVADPEMLRERLADAGLHHVRIDTITWEMAFDSAVHLWNLFTACSPMGAQLAAGLSDAQRAEVIQVLDGMLRERSAGAPGAVLRAELNIGTGTV